MWLDQPKWGEVQKFASGIHWTTVEKKDPVGVRVMDKERAAASKQLGLIHWMLGVADFIDPWMGDKVTSGIGLLDRHTPVRRRAGTTTLCRSWLYSPSQGSMNSATGQKSIKGIADMFLSWLQVSEVDLHQERSKNILLKPILMLHSRIVGKSICSLHVPAFFFK